MLKKVGEVLPPCLNPEHNPPAHIVLEPGVYEHTCPGCGHTVSFTVPHTIMRYDGVSKIVPKTVYCTRNGAAIPVWA